jgi:sec-independent protein translocase protein TatC
MYKLYFLELKNRCFLVFLTWLSLILVGYLHKETLLYLIIEKQFYENNNSNSKIYYFIFTDVLEVFSVYLELILFVSLQISFFYFLYHCFIFISSGLYISEYIYLKYVLNTIILLTVFSIIISKSFLIPLMWNFFFKFQVTSYFTLHFEAKLSEYIHFFIAFYYIFIGYSQIFLLLLLIFNYMISSLDFIKKFRKVYYYFFMVFSTLISPPDVFSQILISIVLIFFYEFVLFFFILKLNLNKLFN